MRDTKLLPLRQNQLDTLRLVKSVLFLIAQIKNIASRHRSVAQSQSLVQFAVLLAKAVVIVIIITFQLGNPQTS